MSESTLSMLERVARALCKADGTDPDADWSEWKPNLTDPPRLPAWKEHVGAARAAIEAMRDPPERIIAAIETKAEERYRAAPAMQRWYGDDVWNAGIDAILSEGGNE